MPGSLCRRRRPPSSKASTQDGSRSISAANQFHRRDLSCRMCAISGKPMDRLTIQNFRCFREGRTVRLAPLTLLVGENSTGKTSFMEMVRMLWNAVYNGNHRPDMKDAPCDIGASQAPVHQERRDDGLTTECSAGFGIGDWKCAVQFAQVGFRTEVVRLKVENSLGSAAWSLCSDSHVQMEVETANGRWLSIAKDKAIPETGSAGNWGLPSMPEHCKPGRLVPAPGCPEITPSVMDVLSDLALAPYSALSMASNEPSSSSPPSATATAWPCHERARYPSCAFLDPGGSSAPSFLSSLTQSGDRQQWQRLKAIVEAHGQQTGLFDEVRIQRQGDAAGSDSLQAQFEVRLESRNGTWHSLADAGRGVSQIFPVIGELINPRAPPMLLLRQPEAHLHPSAQAGLGSILCNVAFQGRQLLVETHSDYLSNRVRMDVRDRTTRLKPEDVSILFFERTAGDVSIHNLRIDKEGNVLDSPAIYRQFFMDEVNRSLGI